MFSEDFFSFALDAKSISECLRTESFLTAVFHGNEVFLHIKIMKVQFFGVL